jgi:hypothetical protein
VAPSLSSHLRGFPTEPAFRFLYPEIAEILKADWERANLNASEAARSEVRKLLAKSCASYAPESEGSYEEIVAHMENAAAPTDFNTPPPSTCPPTLVQTNFLSSPNATDAMSWLTTSLSSTLSSLTTGPGKPGGAPRAYTSTRMIPAYARAADPGKPTCFAATTTSEFANAHQYVPRASGARAKRAQRRATGSTHDRARERSERKEELAAAPTTARQR